MEGSNSQHLPKAHLAFSRSEFISMLHALWVESRVPASSTSLRASPPGQSSGRDGPPETHECGTVQLFLRSRIRDRPMKQIDHSGLRIQLWGKRSWIDRDGGEMSQTLPYRPARRAKAAQASPDARGYLPESPD